MDRKWTGIYPMQGKLLNVRRAGNESVSKNKEVQNIMKILGIKRYWDNEEMDALRYGRVMMMTDQVKFFNVSLF